MDKAHTALIVYTELRTYVHVIDSRDETARSMSITVLSPTHCLPYVRQVPLDKRCTPIYSSASFLSDALSTFSQLRCGKRFLRRTSLLKQESLRGEKYALYQNTCTRFMSFRQSRLSQGGNPLPPARYAPFAFLRHPFVWGECPSKVKTRFFPAALR